MYPKVVALDTDWTIFKGHVDQSKFGKGRDRFSAVEDCLEPVGNLIVRDKRNRGQVVEMYPDIPRIVTDIIRNGAVLAIVARSKSKAIYDRALRLFKAEDPNSGSQRPIIDLVKFNEVYDEEKVIHFRKIKEWSGLEYSDMMLFDDESANGLVRVVLGVTFQFCRDKKGLTFENYYQGIDQWRRCQHIRSPYLGQQLSSYRQPMLIGYAGMDEDTINLLVQGKNRVDMKESARWGYASYIADSPAVANFFREWIKKDAFGKSSKTLVCEIWARDKDKFLAANKIWVPEHQLHKTSIKGGNIPVITQDQEDRDRQVATQWGVQMPYILFSRHTKMLGMHLPGKEHRFNEMVVYTQIQDALLVTIPLSEAQLEQRLKVPYLRYEQQIRAWNITLPEAAIKESRSRDSPLDHQLHL